KELETQLLKAYDSQLVVKEVSVVVQTAVFTVYVTGAVLRPGRIDSFRVLTPFEAIIEAGIDHTKANLSKGNGVREIGNGKTESSLWNFKNVIKAKSSTPFTLKPMDKIYVPERFMWY